MEATSLGAVKATIELALESYRVRINEIRSSLIKIWAISFLTGIILVAVAFSISGLGFSVFLIAVGALICSTVFALIVKYLLKKQYREKEKLEKERIIVVKELMSALESLEEILW